MYHAGILKVTQRTSKGLTFQGSYVFSKLMTDADSFAGSTGAMDAAQPELEYSIGVAGSDPHHQAEYGVRAAVRRRSPLAHVRLRQQDPRRLAHCRGAELRERHADRRHRERAASDLQRHEPAERDGRRLARADRRRRVRPAGRSLPESRRRSPRRSGRWATPLAGTRMSGGSGICRRTSVWRRPSRSRARCGSTCARKSSICSTASSGARPKPNFASANFGLITSQGNSPRQMQFGVKLYW